jgi:dienelactone hydrolase
MRFWYMAVLVSVMTFGGGSTAKGQTYGLPDQGERGDEMIQEYLRGETEEIHRRFFQNVESVEDWKKLRPKYKEEYFYMLGLWPMPQKTPLKATITRTLQGDDYIVDMLHYQSRPQLYVTANLYRPKNIAKGQHLPAVLYVCGHSSRGRSGNKTAFQSHGIWFARHGYICLILDTLQLGEIAAIHHGTYREGRWWWHSRGYTPAGVECLNGIRGIDYLVSRPDVDPERIAVTGISGGGAATFWIAAADERAKVAVPVSGMADLMSYVPNRVINGHCDCMFLYNTFQWPWTCIAALVAPRPLLFVNSDQDSIFPMDANQRVINRLEQVYSLYGAGDFVDSVVSIGGHAYRQDIRQAVYRFINMHLKNDASVVSDSEVDLVTGPDNNARHPIEPERLRVFADDSDIPADELNTTIDQRFVPIASVEPPRRGEYEGWKASLLAELRRVTFRYFPERIPPAKLLEQVQCYSAKRRFAAKHEPDDVWLESEPGIKVRLQLLLCEAALRCEARAVDAFKSTEDAKRVLMVVRSDSAEAASTLSRRRNADSTVDIPQWIHDVHEPGDHLYVCAPRGVDQTRWTRKNPPNYVERSHVLLGRTVDTGRVWDVIATARYLRGKYNESVPVYVLGEGGSGVLAAYAALWEPDITGVILNKPPLSHMSGEAPQFLNVLRVCDIPDVLGMLAPRALTVYDNRSELLRKVAAIYAAH